MTVYGIGACALNQTALDWDGNAANIRAAITEARQAGVSFLCLPELAISGYGCEDAFWSPAVQATALEVLKELLPETKGLVVAIGLPLVIENTLFNSCALVANGEIAGIVLKRHLAGDGVYYEPRWFKPWPAGKRVEISLYGKKIVAGDYSFQFGPVRLGFEICEDAWVSHRRGEDLVPDRVNVIFNPSASHFAIGKEVQRRSLIVDGAKRFGVTYAYANLLGNDAGRLIFDGNALIAQPDGSVVCPDRLSFKGRMLAVVSKSFEAKGSPAGERTESVVSSSWQPTEVEVVSSGPRKHSWEQAKDLHAEEFGRAVALGLYDYLRKSRSQGFAVSLSGGADSAAVSYLCWLALHLATEELGFSRVQAELSYIPKVSEATSVSQLTARLLTCVYQRTKNSSLTTYEAARQVARGVEATFLTFDIEDLVQGYCDLVTSAGAAAEIPSSLNWKEHDLELQNIQCRTRAPGIWLVANLKRALLLATSNRSEAAVGYTTMDGDTCGGLSPIAGIDKPFLRRWLSFVETTGLFEVGPCAALHAVNQLRPTAELRPEEFAQSDESDLMPYDILDAIEGDYVSKRLSPREILLDIESRFPNFDRQTLGGWIERFFNLWCRNQWKRERYAPSFHVDDESLDPKSWYRFPILSGGLARELRELRAEIAKTKP